MIEIKNVSKSFKNHKVLKDVSLICPSGEITGITGHNGSGKTVLFKCICGLLHTDQGKITVDGQQIGKRMIKNAGVIIENPAFLDGETGFRNLDYLYRINNRRDKNAVREAIEKVGLDPELKKKVKHYSLGMRQRLAIAQAIMENPDILILDEPMNGLDKKGVEEMRILFMELKEQGKTILLASHNKEDIDILCDQVYEMEMGVLSR
jgi:ABC-2 type transport system ATP-binding protein